MIKPEHIQHYPTGEFSLKFLSLRDTSIINFRGYFMDEIDGLIIVTNKGNYCNDIWNLKPILYEMEYLYKEISYNGEKFKPIQKLVENFPRIEFSIVPCDSLMFRTKDNILSSSHVLYLINQMLFNWRIDVFNLIGRNLAVPVTNDINPYEK